MSLVLAEPPFYTLQGEGMYVGIPSVFIRTSGCNLRCKWGDNICDTPYASYAPERNTYSIDTLAELVNKINCNHIVITGGEPTMYSDQLRELIREIRENRVITIETNGTNAVQLDVDLLSISPKLASAGNTMDVEEYANNVSQFIEINKQANYQLKFVVDNEESINEFKKFISYMPNIKPSCIYLMPQGITAPQVDSRIHFVARACLENGWNLTDRMHLRIWGNSRGT